MTSGSARLFLAFLVGCAACESDAARLARLQDAASEACATVDLLKELAEIREAIAARAGRPTPCTMAPCAPDPSPDSLARAFTAARALADSARAAWREADVACTLARRDLDRFLRG